MNTEQLNAQRKQLDDETAEVKRLVAEISSKGWRGDLAKMEQLERRIDRLTEDRAAFEAAERSSKALADFTARIGSPMDAASAGTEPTQTVTKAMTGREVNPLAISKASLQALHQAATNRQTLSVKAFSTVEGLLPAQLAPDVLGQVHESRLLDRLPTESITAPSYEILVHSSTTGAPAVVGEGAAKPEVVLNMTSQVLTAKKIAAHIGISYESLSDFPAFLSYAQTEMIRELQDAENLQLISGNGTGLNMTGFLSTSGILTHDASTDTGTGVTVIDSIEKSITQLRVGSALATADLLVLHPTTWSAIRRLKDSTGRFLFIAADSDPTRAEADAIFNVPVLQTTQIAAGSGLMLDTTKFGKVLVREGISVQTGTNADDFSKNISRFVLEERLVLAVERPAAVLAISNLPAA